MLADNLVRGGVEEGCSFACCAPLWVGGGHFVEGLYFPLAASTIQNAFTSSASFTDTNAHHPMAPVCQDQFE